MRNSSRSASRPCSVALALVASAACAASASAQARGDAAAIEPVLVPVEWPRPVYPQIAQSARVQGEVEVAVDVRPDGSVAAAEVVRGVPLLNQAAVDAARGARFECRGCVDPLNRYALYVTFRLSVSERVTDPVPPLVVSPTQGWVTTIASPMFVEGGNFSYAIPPVRRITCLYLWKCGAPGNRFRHYSCLWLWPCIWKPTR
jgi:TonB family protein